MMYNIGMKKTLVVESLKIQKINLAPVEDKWAALIEYSANDKDNNTLYTRVAQLALAEDTTKALLDTLQKGIENLEMGTNIIHT